MSTILERALEHLNSMNTSSVGILSHPLDESRMKEMLKFFEIRGLLILSMMKS